MIYSKSNPPIRKRNFTTGILGALVLISTVWYSHSLSPQQGKKIAIGSTRIAAAAVDSFPTLPAPQWVGKHFVALVKPPLFRKFGYELYLAKNLSAATSRIDTSMETDRHHIRYDKICGKTLIVTAVGPARSNEYLVTFSVGGSDLTLYSITHKGAIEGLVFSDDLEKADARWVGKNVYSRRRLISTYDSITGMFSTLKVAIQEKLQVMDVQLGTSPLPPKPIWLIVKTQSKQTGLIPVCISWTNVMKDKCNGSAPWAEEIFETNPQTMYAWDSLTWNAINSHTIVSGMTKEQVRVSWGTPQRMKTDSTKSSCIEQWLYGGQYICFVRDTVVSVGAN